MANSRHNRRSTPKQVSNGRDDRGDRVQRWLANCMPSRSVSLTAARNLRDGLEREVWDCRCQSNAAELDVILTIFRPGSLETVNTNLPPELVSEKCFLVMSELPALGIPTPAPLGYAAAGGEAAVLCERVARTEWVSGTRVIAARILACLHNLEEPALSSRLRELVRLSDPLECRTTGGQAPRGKDQRLVHGDYFSKNILPTVGGLCIIDWETFGWGDPMWDLGFLVGADPNLTDEEVGTVIAEYGSSAAVDRERLMWHRRSWSDFWKERESKSSGKTGTDHALRCA